MLASRGAWRRGSDYRDGDSDKWGTEVLAGRVRVCGGGAAYGKDVVVAQLALVLERRGGGGGACGEENSRQSINRGP